MIKGSIFISKFLYMETKKTPHVLSLGEYPLSLHTSAHAMLSKEIRWFWRFPNQPCLIADGYKIIVPIKITILGYSDIMTPCLDSWTNHDKPISSNSTVGAFQQNPAIFGMSSTRKEGMHPMHPSVSVPPSASPFAKGHQGKWFLRVSLDHVSDGMVHCFSNAAKNQLEMCAC